MAGITALVVAVGVLIVILRPAAPLEPGVVCTEPPAEELAVESGVGVTLEPNPIVSGGTGNLTVMAMTGLYAEWQCWDGSRWVPTHYLTRGGEPVEHDEVGYIPAVGFLPGAVAVTIPRVPAGTYRISDTTADGEELVLIVRVLEIVQPTTTTTGSTTTTAGPGAENVPFDVGPLQARNGHSVVWTGEEMIVWGGAADENDLIRFADGAAFDPETNTWRVISVAPLEPRLDHHAVWSGSEMLIVGGAGRRDGAAYDPASDTWRPIAEAPFLLIPASGRSGWTDSRVAWTGDRLVVWEVRSDRVAVYNLATDSWTVLPGVGMDAAIGVLRWTGREVIALGIAHSGPGLAHLQAWLLQDGLWMPTAPSGTSDVVPWLTAWSGSELLALTEYGTTLAYQPTDDTWSRRDPAPADGCEFLSEPVEIPGRGVLVPCDHGMLYEDGDWTVVRIAGSIEARHTVWTGTEVLRWGATCCYVAEDLYQVQAWRWAPPD